MTDDATIAITLNGSPRALGSQAGPPTVADLLRDLDLGDARVAVEVNGDVVPRERHGAMRLAAGDRVEVVTFVGGG